MGILKVGSTNPNLSWILQKNPATIAESKKPFTKAIRKGMAYGWFNENASEFTLWFRDSDLESSFADGIRGEFEYLDTTRYGSPYLPISLITNCLSTAAKKIDDHDVDGFHAYATTAIKVPNLRFQQALTRHYTGVADISTQPLHGKFYEVTVQAPKVYTALNVMQIICLMQCLCDDDTYVPMREADIEKYINCLNAANAPYYVRYLFGSRTISNRRTFEKLRSKLQGPHMIMNFGDTRQQRFDAISELLKGGETLIDIGCGELFYSLRLAGRYDTTYAVDLDHDLQEANRGKVEKRKIENLIPIEAVVTSEWVQENEELFDEADVLLTEVVEHMPLDEAGKLLDAILATNCRQVIVTTPNKDFNKFYGFEEDQMRHYDHKWEMGFDDYCNWIQSIPKSPDKTPLTFGVGDFVEGCHTTSLTVFARDHEATSLKEAA
jgi:Cyclopropane fatty acid synthase and related methyltransferases